MMDKKSGKTLSIPPFEYWFATKDVNLEPLSIEQQKQECRNATELLTKDMDKKTRFETLNNYFAQNDLNFECFSIKEKSE
jgi:hypothetical protein